MPPRKTNTTKVILKLNEEERAALARAAKDFPDKPSVDEAAQRLLDMELFKKARGGADRQ